MGGALDGIRDLMRGGGRGWEVSSFLALGFSLVARIRSAKLSSLTRPNRRHVIEVPSQDLGAGNEGVVVARMSTAGADDCQFNYHFYANGLK
jgi:hypothetical protein